MLLSLLFFLQAKSGSLAQLLACAHVDADLVGGRGPLCYNIFSGAASTSNEENNQTTAATHRQKNKNNNSNSNNKNNPHPQTSHNFYKS
jgi:hypothetical protein